MNVTNITKCAASFLAVSAMAAAAAMAGVNDSLIIGPADPLAVDQPRVTVEILDPITLVSLGPQFASQFLLDTGAQGHMAAGYAVIELEDAGYQTDGTFYELGVGGLNAFDVSIPYRFDIAGSDYERITLGTDVRFLSNIDLNFGSFGGIVGMPAMVHKVTELYLRQMLAEEDDPYGFGFDYIGVFFSTDDPPATTNTRYTADLTVVDFPAPEQPDPSSPLPTYGPLPFIRTAARHNNRQVEGDFVFDTGAQLTMLSPAMATSLGLDTDGEGDFFDEAVGVTEFQGAGGTVEVPLLLVDKIILPTNEGVDLVWTDLELPVYHIDDSIGGIFGSDLLTTGWFRAVFDTRDTGAFERLYLDFRDSDNGNGQMVIDVADNYDQLVYIQHPDGDANRDGTVNLDDFIILKQNYGLSDASWSQGDFNGDGEVNLDDFIILKQNYGSSGQ